MSDVKFTVDQAAEIEQTLGSSGYALLVDYWTAHAGNATNALTRQATDWEKTNYLRGKLAGLALTFPDEIRKQYPT